MPLKQQIIIDDLKFEREEFKLDISYVSQKNITALVGPSGCGKTTVLRLLAGLERPLKGKIIIGKHVLVDNKQGVFISPEKRNIGMVFQSARLVPHLSVVKNIIFNSKEKISEKQMVMFERLGIIPLLDRPSAGLSGGEAQRVALARALSRPVSALLLDEPLSAIDPESKEELLNYFAQILPTLNIPIIYVTHSLEEAGRLASDFAMMEKGKIIAKGDGASVLSHYGRTGFDGVASIINGTVRDVANDGLAVIDIGKQQAEIMGKKLNIGAKVNLHLWARDIILARKLPTEISARNALEGKISNIIELANGQVEVRVNIEGQEISSIVLARTIKEMSLKKNQSIIVLFKSASVQYLF